LPLSIDHHNDENLEFIVYPNPASDLLKIQISLGNSNEPTLLSVLDVYGQLVIPQTKVIGRSVNLNIELLNPGVYFLQLMRNNKSVLKKFIRQ
jgi:hypothetical protein